MARAERAKERMVVSETTRTRSFRSFRLIRTLGFVLIGATCFWLVLSSEGTCWNVCLCSVLLAILFRIDGREAKEGTGKETGVAD